MKHCEFRNIDECCHGELGALLEADTSGMQDTSTSTLKHRQPEGLHRLCQETYIDRPSFRRRSILPTCLMDEGYSLKEPSQARAYRSSLPQITPQYTASTNITTTSNTLSRCISVIGGELHKKKQKRGLVSSA